MSFEEIQTASVVRYPYLWVREAGHGETEGRKNRPVAEMRTSPDWDRVPF